MNEILRKGLTLTVLATSLPFVASAVKPYKPEISTKFIVDSELQGQIQLNLTAPTAESVMSGSGWWATETEGDPLPEGTVMTITVTRSCSSVGESNIPVFTRDDVTPGQTFEFIDDNQDNPLQTGKSYTYYCKVAVTEEEVTEQSTEASSYIKFGLSLDMPTDAEFVENEDGSVTISYTAPSTYSGGEVLPLPLSAVEIYRLGEWDSTPSSGAEPFQIIENPENGSEVVFTDPEPTPNKQNKWYVKALCNLGDGGVKVSSWIGYDVPYGVNDLTLVTEGIGVRLSWTAPTTGLNSYYGSKFDPSRTRYKVYRAVGNDKSQWQLIAEDLTDTTYVDTAEDLEEPIMLNYDVVAYNNVGDGSDVFPDNTYSGQMPYVVGPFYSLPFEENVSVDKKTDKVWLAENPSGGDTWEYMNPFKIGNSYSPTATIEGPEGRGVMGVNYTDWSYNRAGTKNRLSTYGIDLTQTRKPVLRFSYYAIPGNDTQIDVVAVTGGEATVLRNIKIYDDVDINTFGWTADNWREVEIDLSEYAGTGDFRIGFDSWYVNTGHTTMISKVSIVDEGQQSETFIVDEIEYEVIEDAEPVTDLSSARNVRAIRYHGSAGTVTVPWYVMNGDEEFDVTEVGAGAFAENATLSEVAIETPVIAGGAFENCPALSKVVMNENTTAIGSRAFADCPELKRVEFGATEVPAIEADAFAGIHPTCTGDCPDEAYDAYKAHEALQGITFDVPNGIDSVWSDFVEADVYTADGVLVLRGADKAALRTLAPGIYIVGAGEKTSKIVIR